MFVLSVGVGPKVRVLAMDFKEFIMSRGKN